MLKIFKDAFGDLHAGLKLSRVWVALASEDIGDQHKRTTLGPLWLLVNYLVFLGTFVFLMHGGKTDYNYPAFAATGLFVWFYIMEIINTSVSLFQREESFIKGTTLPLSVYVMRFFTQSVIRSSYALMGCLLVLFLSGIAFTPLWLWSALGILIILLTVPAAIIVFAFLGVFFPDAQYLISNLMRVGMFLTPVFWTYEKSGGIRHIFYHWNPFTYYLEMVRFPIVWQEVPLKAFMITPIIGLGLWVLALFLLGRLRRQVVFML